MTTFSMPATMRAVVLKDEHKVVTENRPTPQITADHELIIKVAVSGLCGEMHREFTDIRLRSTLV